MNSHKQKIFITGVSGLLGSNLAMYFRDKAQVVGQFYRHPVAIEGIQVLGANLCDSDLTKRKIANLKPDIIIHCASRTDVDGVEEDREGGWQSNVLTTRVILDAIKDSATRMIYISTDAVYPGKQGPYSEDSSTAPCNWYGQTKIEGERLSADREDSLVLRTNIYGWNIQKKESLAEWFLNRIQKNMQVNGFADVRFSSIYTFQFANILEKCLNKNLYGIYNCASRDSMTKFEFGKQIALLCGKSKDLVKESKLNDINFKAQRGLDLSLNVGKLEKDLGCQLPKMMDGLQQFFDDLRIDIQGRIRGEKPSYHEHEKR